jgi:hypothetical protein
MAQNTKIIDAEQTLSVNDLGSTVMIPVGRAGYPISENVGVDTLKEYINQSRDNITSGTTIAKVYSSGYMKITISNNPTFKFTLSALLGLRDNIDIGDHNYPFKDFYIKGGINVTTAGSDAAGDMYYRDSNGKFQRLAKGANGQVLRMTSNLPSWQNDSNINTQGDVFNIDENSPLDCNFPVPYPNNTPPSNIILTLSCYDNNGDQVVPRITNITYSGFTIETSQSCNVHYITALKS